MTSNLYQSMNNPAASVPNGVNNMAEAFRQFAATVQGNPQQIVMNMVANGQMTQQQLNQIQAMVPQVRSMFSL